MAKKRKTQPPHPALPIIRGLVAVTGKGTMLFNDRRRNGGRSIKVWGWNRRIYDEAMVVLAARGIHARLVRTPMGKRGDGGHLRIHVDPVRAAP